MNIKIPLLISITIAATLTYGQSKPSELLDGLIADAEKAKRENPSYSKKMYEQGLSKAVEFNEPYYQGKINVSLGGYYLDNHLLDSAIFHFTEALELLPPGDKLEADAYVGLGTSVYYRNNLVLAMDYFIRALRVFENTRDDTGKARVLNNLGAISEKQENFQQAFSYYKQSYDIKEQQQDSAGMARSLNNLGSCSIPLKQYSEAIDFLLRSVAIKQALKETRGLANSYANLGIAYKEMGKYAEAIAYHRKNLAEDKRTGNPGDLFYGYNNLANVYLRQRLLEKATLMADSALFYAKPAGDVANLMEAYGTLYMVAEQRGNKTIAFDYLKNYVLFKDSLLNLEKTQAIEDLRTQYETERKEKTIKELEQSNRIKDLEADTARQWRYGLLIFLGLSLLVVAVLYNRYQLKQRTARVLDEKNKELNELNGLKDRLFAVISHDLKSPLSAFNTLTASLSLNLEHINKESLATYLNELNASSREVYGMLNNLLEWAITQTGRFPFNPELFNAHALCEEVIQQLASASKSKNIQVINDLSLTTSVYADRGMIQIVVRNLLANAIKFTAENTTVYLYSEVTLDGITTLNMKDEGIGMSERDTKRLFRTEEDVQSIGAGEANKGTGIGLLLCKELVEKNGGKIYVESKIGAGSNFYFTLPIDALS